MQTNEWREASGRAADGSEWRIRSLRHGAAEVSLGTGFGGDGPEPTRAGVQFYAPPEDRASCPNEAAAKVAAVALLRQVARDALALADLLASEVGQ